MSRSGDDDEAALRRRAASAAPGGRGTALAELGRLLERQGDTSGAKAAWQELITTEPGSEWAESALCDLLNQLADEGDTDGLRAAYDAGVAGGIGGALYGLERLGRVLRDRGDLEGWRQAWQQAVDAGYEDADGLLWELSPPAEDDQEPREVPAGFDPRNIARIGANALDHGLPALPADLNYHMAVPMAYWAADHSAVVLVLTFHRFRGAWEAMADMVTFTRRDGQWQADPCWTSTGFHDPLTTKPSFRGLGGQALTYSGGGHGDSDAILHGRAARSVKYLALIQDGHEDRRRLDSHFGAWVIRTSKPGPLTVAAINRNGDTVDQISWPYPELRQS